jgi:hypothetical protein
MSGSENPSRAGRLTALATLAASAVLFAGALFGIATIDPNADAASPAGGPTIHNVSMPSQGSAARHDRRDCPFKKHDRAKPPSGEGAGSGVSS